MEFCFCYRNQILRYEEIYENIFLSQKLCASSLLNFMKKNGNLFIPFYIDIGIYIIYLIYSLLFTYVSTFRYNFRFNFFIKLQIINCYKSQMHFILT